ncbi:ATP-binding protein [Serratia sp. H402Y]|uniref:ATP-binding protein n=1 Tax=Serratia sp. H402Y TaxID=3444320 RepID=UPI003EB6A7FA
MAQMKVSARTVDMLGRQQIAGIPTAIHELFKNAHDAYAKNVEIDFFESPNLLTLRDDGVGMTKEDFISKWLTIGTSSKLGINRKSVFIPEGMNERPLMGEKGIGRLAIASIGRLVLVLSRAIREEGMHEMVAALVHWSQFEIPEINLSDIIIPVRTFLKDEIPGQDDIQSMSNEIMENIDKLHEKVPEEIYNTIKKDLENFTFSPDVLFSNLQSITLTNWTNSANQDDGSLKNKQAPILDGFFHGTHFIIMPCDPALELDIKKDENNTTELQKILVGFANSLSDRSEQVMATKFRIHRGNAEPEELIEEGFFTPEDARNADHYIEGEFDDFGQFKGTVTVYRGDPVKHIINWNENYGAKTNCGRFKIKFSYLQGEASDSTVPTQTYAEIKSKLNMYGGVYLYKDGIRVLPYGKPEFDFLRIEERRTKRASTAFFSYRWMFGAIEIEHNHNAMLIEKAGREGLIENIAYREFKNILNNFFDQLAADFFRENSINDRFWEIKEIFRSQAKIQKETLAKRKKSIGFKRSNFQHELESFFLNYDNNIYSREMENLIRDTEHLILTSNKGWSTAQKYNFIYNVMREVKNKNNEFNKSIKISKPNIGLNKLLLRQWESYLILREKITEDIFEPAQSQLDGIITHYMSVHSLSFSKREKITETVNDERRNLNENVNIFKKRMKDHVNTLDNSIKNKVREKTLEFTDTINSVMAEINKTPLDTIYENEANSMISSWEKQLDAMSSKTDEYFSKIKESIEIIINDLQGDEVTSIDTLIALETENEQVKDSLNQYFDFAQLGMSIGIIQHEFSSTIRSVRQSIKMLKPWADQNPNLNTIFFNISHSFSHLDGYLKMFTPLSRRLYRSKIELSGKEIARYLKDIFDERMKRHSITLESTDKFLNMVNNVYPSTFLPVFINVIDNAIYWLNTQRVIDNPDKKIVLATQGSALTISNNGPVIPTTDRENIFEFSFSRKESGRGMGLYISKETLNREGFDIKLANGDISESPCFIIENLEKEVSA